MLFLFLKIKIEQIQIEEIELRVLFNKRFSENQTVRGQSFLVNYLGATTIYAKRLGFERATHLVNESIK